MTLLQWFLVFTCLIMVVLAFLGFTKFSRALPLHDKLLHFLCFCIATGVFYFIIDVEECVVNITVSLHLLNYSQECETNMVLATFSINLHRIHMFLLRWYTKRIYTGCSTSWVLLYLIPSYFLKMKLSLNILTGVMLWFTLFSQNTCRISHISLRQTF